MEAGAEERSGYLDFSRVSPGELHGDGRRARAARVALAALVHDQLGQPELEASGRRHRGGDSANAWQVFTRSTGCWSSACAAPFILAWIIARGHKLTWKPGEVTMIVGIVAFVLILCNGIILGRPGDSVDIGLGIGYFVGLLASLGPAGRGLSAPGRSTTTARKPPGVI